MKNVQGITVKNVSGKIELHLPSGMSGTQLVKIQKSKEFKSAVEEVMEEKEEGDICERH